MTSSTDIRPSCPGRQPSPKGSASSAPHGASHTPAVMFAQRSADAFGAHKTVSPTISRRSIVTESRLRPGRQGVQRIYRLTQEKAMIGEYEYLESIGVPRAQALQVMSRASTAFEAEMAKKGLDPKAMKFGAEEMCEVVDFLKLRGVDEKGVGALVIRHPAVLSYSVKERLEPLFEYMEAQFDRNAAMFVEDIERRPSLLGLDADENVRKMVDYLLASGKTKEEVMEYLLRSL